MEKFLTLHADQITGCISCFDRVLFKGHLALGYPGAMEELLTRQGLLIKDFKSFVTKQADRIKQHAHDMAQKTGRPLMYLHSRVAKEQEARRIAQRDQITQGLVCIFAQVDPCRSFKVVLGSRRPRIQSAHRKCLSLYYYFLEPELGLLHVHIQTWFPLTCQVYVNGHQWLERQMDIQGIKYQRADNAFLFIEDPARAQLLADQFAHLDWPARLGALAKQVNPLMQDLLCGYSYYWATNQAEYATDVMFKDRAALQALYPHLLRYATLSLSAEDVLRFLGRKLYGQFQGEILNSCNKRVPGTRVKHRMKANWIKMYDKHGCVLRVETVINDPYEFKVRRQGKRKGVEVMDWYPLPKGVAYLPRYVEVSRAANQRYLAALSVVNNPAPVFQYLDRVARPVQVAGRSFKGFNPVAREDLDIFQAVMRGEHAIQGFRNRDICQHLFAPATGAAARRRSSARTSRILKRLHMHGVIAKIPRSHRWRLSVRGQALLAAAIQYRQEYMPQALGSSS